MSDKKGPPKGNEDKKADLPKVEINPAYSDDDNDEMDVQEEPVAEGPLDEPQKKASLVSADSGVGSQDGRSGQQEIKKDAKGAGPSKTPKGKLGEGSNQLKPGASPSKDKRSKSPIKKMKDTAQNITRAVVDAMKNFSPSKKSGLSDSLKVEQKKPEPVSPKKETKKPKRIPMSKNLSELYEKVDTDEESCESAVTTTSNVPGSDSTSVDEKSESLDDLEVKDDVDDFEVKDDVDDSEDAKK